MERGGKQRGLYSAEPLQSQREWLLGHQLRRERNGIQSEKKVHENHSTDWCVARKPRWLWCQRATTEFIVIWTNKWSHASQYSAPYFKCSKPANVAQVHERVSHLFKCGHVSMCVCVWTWNSGLEDPVVEAYNTSTSWFKDSKKRCKNQLVWLLFLKARFLFNVTS